MTTANIETLRESTSSWGFGSTKTVKAPTGASLLLVEEKGETMFGNSHSQECLGAVPEALLETTPNWGWSAKSGPYGGWKEEDLLPLNGEEADFSEALGYDPQSRLETCPLCGQWWDILRDLKCPHCNSGVPR